MHRHVACGKRLSEANARARRCVQVIGAGHVAGCFLLACAVRQGARDECVLLRKQGCVVRDRHTVVCVAANNDLRGRVGR